jgi:hypothetical protein
MMSAAQSFLRRLYLLSWASSNLHFMEPEVSVMCLAYKGQPFDTVLCQLNRIHAFHFFQLHFNIVQLRLYLSDLPP